MPHRALLQRKVRQHASGEVWSPQARGDLEVAVGFLTESGNHRRTSVGYTAAVLGALRSYSRPFTERPDPAANQSPFEQRCFLSLAADLGADLQLHSALLQMRDEIIALSEIVRLPSEHVNARRFRYPDPRFARITHALNRAAFRKLAAAMRVACAFFQAEMDARFA